MRHRGSPILKGILGIPKSLVVERLHRQSSTNERACIEVLHEAKKYQTLNVQSKMEERCANDTLGEFGPSDDIEANLQTDTKLKY